MSVGGGGSAVRPRMTRGSLVRSQPVCPLCLREADFANGAEKEWVAYPELPQRTLVWVDCLCGGSFVFELAKESHEWTARPVL